jgi:hypothetical protein
MTVKIGDMNYLTDKDLQVVDLGFWPRVEITNPELRDYYQKKFGRTFLGADDLVSHSQVLVSRGMNFDGLADQLMKEVAEGKDLGEVNFGKTATGIGRGHSLGGLAGVVVGLHGTKMLDSGLTGLCASRSLATSSRRRETTSSEIVVPEALVGKPELLQEYMELAQGILDMSSEFKSKFGKLEGIESFNKVTAYNSPADIFMVLPLDTMATIYSEARADAQNINGQFLPREVHELARILPEIADNAGQGIMFRQRVQVPRDTYLHYTVFKDPSDPNLALELGTQVGMHLNPLVSIEEEINMTVGFRERLAELRKRIEVTKRINDPNELHEASLQNMYALRAFVQEYNDAVRIEVTDSLSWRVWSEQKRHATLRQHVESVYSGADRATEETRMFWPMIEEANRNGAILTDEVLDNISRSVVIDTRLRKSPELVLPYVHLTLKQLMFYDKLREAGIGYRDALFAVPRNIRLRTTETYDFANLVDLELPLRLCTTCEPERRESSWKKREAIARVIPELDFLLQPKCNLGFCTEGKYCGRITDLREYGSDLHTTTKQAMLGKARVYRRCPEFKF